MREGSGKEGERSKEGSKRRGGGERDGWGWGSIVTLYHLHTHTHTPFPAFLTFQCLKVRQSSLQFSHQHHSTMKETYIQTCSSYSISSPPVSLPLSSFVSLVS